MQRAKKSTTKPPRPRAAAAEPPPSTNQLAIASPETLLAYAAAGFKELAIANPDETHLTSVARVLDGLALALVQRCFAPTDDKAETKMKVNALVAEANGFLANIEKVAYPFTAQQDRRHYLRGRNRQHLPKLPSRKHLGRTDAVKALIRQAAVFTDLAVDGQVIRKWEPRMRTNELPYRPMIWGKGGAETVAREMVRAVGENFVDLLPVGADRRAAEVKLEAAIHKLLEPQEAITAEQLTRAALVACGADGRKIKDWF